MATPLPKGDIAAVIATLFCESYQANVLFPFVGALVLPLCASPLLLTRFLSGTVFMVHSFKISPTEEGEGYYVGALTAVFFLGQFISSTIWVRAACLAVILSVTVCDRVMLGCRARWVTALGESRVWSWACLVHVSLQSCSARPGRSGRPLLAG